MAGCLLASYAFLNLKAQVFPPGGSGGTNSAGGSSSYVVNTNFLISAQTTNVVLNWRSGMNKIYLLEHRATLTGATQWGELTNYYPAAVGTNWTKFVHTNIARLRPMNFYRLFDVTPVAKDDFFAVDQDSSANQLGILQNDLSPNGDTLFLAGLSSAPHGDISYTTDATTFQYTPKAGFYGVDSFTYALTTDNGDVSSNATVKVFVNQSGNSSPVVPDITITLDTNVFSTSFNALTNAADADGDMLSLFSVGTPNLGSISNNANGHITYTRNPNLYGADAFTYIVTDGKGGYGLGHVKVLQVDTDGDGMPNQWELANSLDSLTDDSLDDPDNDGVPNLAEYLLGTNPHIADNPLNFQGMTNGMVVSGFVQLPLISLNPTSQTLPVALYVNTNLAASSIFTKGPDGTWFFVWDTTHLTNGNYQVNAGFSFSKPGAQDDIQTIYGDERTICVSNVMSFDRLTSKFTDALFIDANLTVTKASYSVYLYDVSGAVLVHATGLTTTNGQIHLYWDLTDGHGNQISFDSIRADFYITPQVSAHGQTVRPMDANSPFFATQWFVKEGGMGSGIFTVAYGFDSVLFYDNHYREQMIVDGIINFLDSPFDFSSYFLLPAANVPYTSAFRYDNDDDRITFLNACQSSTFLFWNGHGSDTLITGNPDHSYITSAAMGTNLMNNQSSWSSGKKRWIPKPDQHPYKLVILNSCHSYSEEWCKTFGMDFDPNGSTTSTAMCGLVGRNKQAFVSWPVNIIVAAGDPTGLFYSQYSTGLAIMSSEWMTGYPIYQCMQDYGDYMSTALFIRGFDGQDHWRISGCFDLRRGD